MMSCAPEPLLAKPSIGGGNALAALPSGTMGPSVGKAMLTVRCNLGRACQRSPARMDRGDQAPSS